MDVNSLLHTEVLSSEERWRRWEQRGRDNDARFAHRARRLLWSVVVVASVVLVFFLLR